MLALRLYNGHGDVTLLMSAGGVIQARYYYLGEIPPGPDPNNTYDETWADEERRKIVRNNWNTVTFDSRENEGMNHQLQGMYGAFRDKWKEDGRWVFNDATYTATLRF